MSVVHAVRPYTQLVVTVEDGIGTIKINRPKSLNSLVGEVYLELVRALREFAADPRVVVTVLTGEGRFFSSGADVKAGAARRQDAPPPDQTTVEEKAAAAMGGLSWALLIAKQFIEHPKLLVFALNGPAIGVAASWVGLADIVLASDSAYIQIPFSALGLIPEVGTGVSFTQIMGPRIASEVLLLGRKLSVEDMVKYNFVNQVYPAATFEKSYKAFLREALETNDHKSILEGKKMIREQLIPGLRLANLKSVEGLVESTVEGRSTAAFLRKAEQLAKKNKNKL
ncbi:ClpP/crotonase-like domain-containing protein [Hyaloraphidium curvatum]|nr:ClpP/crotonase-like domain-containing protein [Hyaloraphidium curvatum]